MRIFYIDSENIEDSWVTILKWVDPKDEVYVFYTENSKNIRIEDIDIIKNHKGKLQTLSVNKGPNALDFQLASLLGYHVGKVKAQHIILSGDRGFIPLEEFWKKRAEVLVMENERAFAQYLETGKIPARTRKPSGRIVRTLRDNAERRKVQSILDKSDGYDLAKVYEQLIQAFGDERGLKIYRTIKTQLRD